MSADLEMLLAEIRGAVARGWCAEVNAKKEFDADLAESIVAQIYAMPVFAAPDLARQVIALTADNAALRAKAEKLAEALRERDGGVHDDDCKVFRPAAGIFALPCNCGHDDAEAALTEWETP